MFTRITEKELDQATQKLIDVLDDKPNFNEIKKILRILSFGMKIHDLQLFILKQAFESLGNKDTIKLFNEENIDEILENYNFIRILNLKKTAFYPIDELSLHNFQFIEHLDRNQEFLIKYGLPKYPYFSSVWFEKLIGSNYFTRLPRNLPLCANMIDKFAPVELDFCQSYSIDDLSWRKDPNIRPTGFIVKESFEQNNDYINSIELCNYEEAGLIFGINKEADKIIHDIRENFWEFKIEILQFISAYIDKYPELDLKEGFLNIMGNFLTGEELTLLTELEEKTHKSLISTFISKYPINTSSEFFEKSYFEPCLENLYQYAYHVFCEMNMNLFNKLYLRFRNELKIPSNSCHRLSGKKAFVKYNYFEMINGFGKKKVDSIISDFNEEYKKSDIDYSHWLVSLKKRVNDLTVNPENTGLRCPRCDEHVIYVDFKDLQYYIGLSSSSLSTSVPMI